MFNKQWTRSSYGCAIDKDVCLVVRVRYNKTSRILEVLDTIVGRSDDQQFWSSLARKLGRKPLWISLAYAKPSDRNDVVVCKIDDGDGMIKGSRLKAAAISQLQEAEHNKSTDYIRTASVFISSAKKKYHLGASAPQDIFKATIQAWKTRGILNPCVGSVRAAMVNVFLALKESVFHAMPDGNGNHCILGSQVLDTDVFCYLQGEAFVDSGISQWDGRAAEGFIYHAYDWAKDFSKKYAFEKVRFCFIGRERSEFTEAILPKDESAFFWPRPWEQQVQFRSDVMRDTFTKQSPQLGVVALGLALHGV